MSTDKFLGFVLGALLVLLAAAAYSKNQPAASPVSIDPGKLPRLGAVDARFQSYNVEMAEVTGGNFWKPYGKQGPAAAQKPSAAPSSGSTPVGMNPDMYQYRPPIDLSRPRLRKLAAALGPAYIRVSGTWANTAYFQDSDEPAPATPPKGFSGVLTRSEWKGVIDFAHAVDARLVTSFAFSPGTRNAEGVWTPDQARQLLDDTKAAGGSIAAAEFVNEPTYAAMGGAPPGYNAADYGRDVAACRAFLKQASPNTIFLGPGSVGEGGSHPLTLGSRMLHSADLLQATGPVFDIFSYHLYAAASERCASMGPALQTTAAAALSND
jgi:heparanase